MNELIQIDTHVLEASVQNKNMIVPWYLIAAYCYYELDCPILSDSAFDQLVLTFLKEYDTIEHVHKELVTKRDLEAGTYLCGTYPKITRMAAHNILEEGLTK